MRVLILTLTIASIVLNLTWAFQKRPEPESPVTIKVTQDVSLEPYQRDREKQHIRGILQFFTGYGEKDEIATSITCRNSFVLSSARFGVDCDVLERNT